MSLATGTYVQLIKWKSRHLLETGVALNKIVANAIETRNKNKKILQSCYRYDIATAPKHSNFETTRSNCNCVLCEITREYVEKKKRLHRFKKSFYNDNYEAFYFLYLKAKSKKDESYSELDYFNEMVSILESEVHELKQRRRAVTSTVLHHMTL